MLIVPVSLTLFSAKEGIEEESVLRGKELIFTALPLLKSQTMNPEDVSIDTDAQRMPGPREEQPIGSQPGHEGGLVHY